MKKITFGVWAAVALFASISALGAAASASPAGGRFGGVVSGYHDSKRGSEFYFELPSEVTAHLTPGSILEPDGKSQRIVYYGGRIGFCIDRGIPAGGLATTYRYRGNHSEAALEAARTAMRRGEPRDEAVWAAMDAERRR